MVLQEKISPKVLSTYESERRPVGQELISFDKAYTESWAKSCKSYEDGAQKKVMAKFRDMYMDKMTYTTSILIRYPCSILVFGSKAPKALQNSSPLRPGMRLPVLSVLNQADAAPARIHELLKSDGRFRLLVFIGDIALDSQFKQFQTLAAGLPSPTSFLSLYRNPCISGSPVEILTVHATERARVELHNLPPVFRPWSEEFGWDYWKVYADDQDIHGDYGKAYETCGIDKKLGSLIVVRPDGYIGLIAELNDLDSVNEYFAGFMLPVERTENLGGLKSEDLL